MNKIQLNQEQYNRSLKATAYGHYWVFNKNTSTPCKNPLFTLPFGPSICIVINDEVDICNYELEKLFGRGSYLGGPVSPQDKGGMTGPVFYIK